MYNKSKRAYGNNKSQSNRHLFYVASKKYSNTLKRSNYAYKQDCARILRETKNNDPKTFWGLIKSFNRKQCIEKINVQELYQHFRELNDCDADDVRLDMPDIQACDALDCPITKDEILAAVKGLRNNKACGLDGIHNEYIKSTVHLLMPVYLKLFNLVFDSGIIPESWLVGYIKPIYKNKGSPQDPGNYRGITIVSCLGKLFTSIINTRLQRFSDEVDLIGESQAGFRKRYSTIDHIYVLKALIDVYHNMKKKYFVHLLISVKHLIQCGDTGFG